MINTQASVSAKSKVSVVPPAVAFLGLLKQPEAVVQAQVDQAIQVRTLFGRAVNGACQCHRVPHIQIVKGDVVVAHESQLRVLDHLLLYPFFEGF